MASTLILEKKSEVIKEIVNAINTAKSTTVVHYHGLTVDELTALRVALRAEDVRLKVYKNRLVKIALKQLEIAGLDPSLVGANALVFSNTDEIAGPKLLANFAKEHKKLVLKSAILDGQVILTDELKVIATLPSKDGMIAIFASTIISPLIKFALLVKAIAESKTE